MHCFGDNTLGGLGAQSTQTCYGGKACSLTPLAVQTNERFVSLASSQFAVCGLTAQGQVFCWGMDFQELFGARPGSVPDCQIFGAPNGCTSTPTPGPDGMATLSSARTNSCGIGLDGIAYCWGGNDFDQRGWPGKNPNHIPHRFEIAPPGQL